MAIVTPGQFPVPVYVFYGPVTANPSTALPFPATPILWLSASEEHGIESGTCLVHLSCLADPTTDDSGGIVVYVTGYDGNAGQVAIYQDTNEVLSFTMKATNELVMFAVAAVNAAGQISSQSAPVTLKLNGVPTVPAKLTSVVAIEANGFTEVNCQAAPEADVTAYRLYRGAFGGTFAGAALVQTIQQTEEANYSLQDVGHVNGGVNTYQWYLTAVNSVGESPASDPVLPLITW